MVELKDPVRDALVRELRLFRKGAGDPDVTRLTGLFYLTEILGSGAPARAFDELSAIYREYGTDPVTDVGAYFYLSGWGIGLASVDQRRHSYYEEFVADISTSWRRSERGIARLVTLIRDRDEESRPWAFVSIFQSGNRFQPVLDFNLAHESWTHPLITLNDEPIEFDFHLHKSLTTPGLYNRRFVLPESDIDTGAEFGEVMASMRVAWAMPVWPVWSLASWTADPRILTRMRTFRERVVEVSLEWWRRPADSEPLDLVTDGAIWADRDPPGSMNLPDGWRLGP